MSCVNINHPEFKKQAQRLNISKGHLQNLQHQYQNSNNTDEFASDDWIRDHLHKSDNIITSDAQMQLWWNQYSNPVTVNNPAEYKADAGRFFNEDSISVKELPDGNYECYVSTPIMKDSEGNLHSFNATPLKQEYKGKLIYAEAGTGKTTIADNVNVIDSDVILGEVLGVSRDTAGFFFNTLSAEQKKSFGKKYREEIKRLVNEGKTVITANSSLLENADVIIYNQSARETNNRTNASDRINRYDNVEYHEQTREKINAVGEGKEKIRLTAKEHLADKLLTDTSFKQEKVKRATTLDESIEDFLDSFGMKTQDVEEFSSDTPLFDALHRIINARNSKDITDGIGYSVAFMMQHNPIMRKWILHEIMKGFDFVIPNSTLNKMLQNPKDKIFTLPTGIAKLVGRKKVSLADIINRLPGKNQALRSIGVQIASEWRKVYGKEVGKTSLAKRVWSVISQFFQNLFGRDRRIERQKLVQNIVEALGREDYSFIRGPRIKEGSTERAELLNIEQAFKENPYEADIIKKLSDVGIALTGSTAIRQEGTIYRPANNPLHDIDFSTENGTTRAELEKVIMPLLPNLQHVRTIVDKDNKNNQTETYLTMDREYTLAPAPFSKDFQLILDKDGNEIGKMELSKQELYLNEGVKGKLLDFFVGESPNVFGTRKDNIGGTEYLISKADNAMSKKVTWQRSKDVWDYAWYVPEKKGFDISKLKLRQKQLEADLRKINANEWNLPLDVQKEVSQRLSDYMSSKEGEKFFDTNISKYFPNGETTTISDVLTYISQKSKDSDLRAMARYMLKKVGNSGTKEINYTGKKSGPRGRRTHLGELFINAVALQGKTRADALINFESTIVHEIAHELSVDMLNSNDFKAKKDFLQIYSDFKNLQKQYDIDLGYAGKNASEFLAEFLGRKAFREALRALPSTNRGNIFQRLVDWFKSLLNIPSGRTFMKDAQKAIEKILDANERMQRSTDTSQETAEHSQISQEMEDIKQKAIADGTFMKAPNGKDTHLTERQWLQVRTQAFKNWFGDWENDSANASKVVDENGEPQVVYHNTDREFTKFSKFRALLGRLTGNALFGKGFYFSNYESSALGKVNMPVFLSIKNSAIEKMNSKNDGVIHDFGNGQVWYAAKSPEQIKSATNNKGTFSETEEDVNYDADEDIISKETGMTERQYKEMLDELSLSRDKTDSFLYNYMTKVLGVSPKYKVDESGVDFVYNTLRGERTDAFKAHDRLQKLVNKVFGYEVEEHFSENREEFEKQVDRQLKYWKNTLIDIINDPMDISDRYERRDNIQKNINLLQRLLDKGLDLSEFSEQEINKINNMFPFSNKKLTKKNIGYKIQQLKRQYSDSLYDIQRGIYQRYAILLSAKNRLVALNSIQNLQEIVKDRLLREYDAYTVKESTYNEKVAPKVKLFNAVEKAVKSKSESIEALFAEDQTREISYEELKNRIMETNPEFEWLLKAFHKANPKLKIVVGGKPETTIDGDTVGKFSPKDNILHLSNAADVYTAIHELAHSATYYGIILQVMSNSKQVKDLEKPINDFMDYIRDYIGKNQMNPKLFNTQSIFGVSLSADIYGFTNASEFIAELYGNPAFQELLEQIPAMNKKEYNSLLEQLWDTIINFIKNLIVGDSSAYDQARKLGMGAMKLQRDHINLIYKQVQQIRNSQAQNDILKDQNDIMNTSDAREVLRGNLKSINDVSNLPSAIDKVMSASNLDVWLRDYSTPRAFRDEQKAIESWEKGKKLFGENACKLYYDNNMGVYVVATGFSTRAFPFQLNNNLWGELSTHLDELTGPKSSLFRAILNYYERSGRYPNIVAAHLPSVLHTRADGTSYEIHPLADATTDVIRIDPRRTTAFRKRDFVTMLLHENLHCITTDTLYKVEEGLGTQDEIDFYNETVRLYEVAKKALGERASSFYGMDNIFEFLAEAGSNVSFQKELAKIKDPESKKSLWNKIIDAFSNFFTKFFGTDIKGSVLESTLSEISKQLERIQQPSALERARAEIFNAMAKQSGQPIDITKIQSQRFKTGQQLLNFLTNSEFYSSSSYNRNTAFDGRPVIEQDGSYYKVTEYEGSSEQFSDAGKSPRESIEDIKAIVRQLGYPEDVITITSKERVGEVVSINQEVFNQSNAEYETQAQEKAQEKAEKEDLEEMQKVQNEFDYILLNRLWDKDLDLAKKVTNGEMDLYDAVSEYERLSGESIWGEAQQMDSNKDDVEELNNIISKNFGGYFEGSAHIEQDFPNAPKDISLAFSKYHIGLEDSSPLTAAQALEFLACVNPSLIPQKFRNVGAKFINSVTSQDISESPSTVFVFPQDASEGIFGLLGENTIYQNHDNVLGITVTSQLTQQEFEEEVRNKIDKLIEFAEQGAKIALPVKSLVENIKDPIRYQYLNQQLSRLKERLFEIDMQQKNLQEQYNLTAEPLEPVSSDPLPVTPAEQSSEGNSESKTPTKQEQKESSLERGVKQIQAIKNNGEIHISSQEIREVAQSVATKISDMITYYHENPEMIERIFGDNVRGKDKLNAKSEKEKIDKIKNMTRLQLVNYIGADNIINLANAELFTEQNPLLDYSKNENLDDDTKTKADIFSENFGGLVTLAADELFELEGFTFLSTSEHTSARKGDQRDENSQDSDALLETQGNLQEHWQTESRTQGVLSNSQEVRRAMHALYDITGFDVDGNPIYRTDEYGINKRKDATETINKIVNWTQGMITYQDMIDKLQEQVGKNPWLKPLIDRLTIVKGQKNPNAVFQSQFFSTICKHHQNYTIVIKEKGVLKSIPANTDPLNREVKGQVEALQLLGTHPLLSNGKIDLNALQKLTELSDKLKNLVTDKDNKQISDFDQDAVFDTVREISSYLGYEIPQSVSEEITLSGTDVTSMRTALSYIMGTLNKNKLKASYNVTDYKTGIAGNIVNFVKPFQSSLGLTRDNVTYDNGKTYQEYVSPSYMTKLLQKIANSSQEDFTKFIEEEYGQSEWFRDSDTGEWNIEILEWLSNMTPQQRKTKFDHIVQLSYDKKNYMKDMLPEQYALAALAQYFTDRSASSASDEAFYKIPMLSNKPSFEFIKFKRQQGDFSEGTTSIAKSVIIDGFMKIARQEISRIATFNLRAKNSENIAEISTYETNGKKFILLDFLQAEREAGTTLGKLLDEQIGLAEKGEKLDILSSSVLVDLLRESIQKNIDARVTKTIEGWKNSGLIDSMKNIKGIDANNIERSLREFLWNDAYASANILELTITDPAMYKNAVDLQKRLAEIHAPGLRPNVLATDFNGNRVSDGVQRTFYLKDIEDFVSNICENVAEVLDRKIASATSDSERRQYEVLKNTLVRPRTYNEDGSIKDKGGDFWNINVADAQGFSAPTAYRKKAFMFGKWSEESEQIYEKIKSGNWNAEDIQKAFQPLKPFVYSQVFKSSQVDAPITNLKIGVQNKNSEYLLMMADAMLHSENTTRPNLLRALFRVMEDSAKSDIRKGIDTIQFESAVKVGKMKTIDLSKYTSEEDAYRYMMDIIGDSTRGYNSDYVFEIPFEDYAIQQEIPEHFIDHAQLFGSQARYVLNSDLAYVNTDGSIAKYDYYDPRTGEKKSLTAKEYKAEFEKIAAENINESVNILRQELRLDGKTEQEQNIRIASLLREEIINSPRYGIELLDAIELDEYGNFVFPLSDPIQSKRIEQLLHSIIKNRINKQKIAGGPLVQASNFGFSTELNIKFKDKQGNILKSRKEWEAENGGVENIEGYKAYLKENQAGIAYYECFAPIYSEELFAPYMDENGDIDIATIKEKAPELLEMIGYRIPTEAKYSMAPLRIVGFTPKLSGDLIVLPNDITLLTGSDFDIDKFYVMVREYEKQVTSVNPEELKQKVLARYKSMHKNAVLSEAAEKKIFEYVDTYLDNMEVPKGSTIHNIISKEFQKLSYKYNQVGQGTAGRNNALFNMSYGLLTHENSADQILNPGGFEPQKHMGYLVEAARVTGQSIEELKNKSTKELSKLVEGSDNLIFFDSNQKFYKQNVVAGAILGMFAVQKTAHSVFEGNNISVKLVEEDEKVNLAGFKLGDFQFKNFINLDAQLNSNGELIGKILGSLVASAADAVKDPVLNLMNINNQTAPILTALIRCGMPFETAALFLSQKAVTDIISRYNQKQVKEGYASFEDVVLGRVSELANKVAPSGSGLYMADLTEEELDQGLQKYDDILEFKTLNALSKFINLHNKIKGTTTLSRLNSITSAVGPQITNTLMNGFKIGTAFPEKGGSLYIGKNRVTIGRVFQDHPILRGFYQAYVVADEIFSRFPTNSGAFKIMAENLDIIRSEKKLQEFSDFYLSYKFFNENGPQSIKQQYNIPQEQGLEYFIDEFPNEFLNIRQNPPEELKDNLLIKSIGLTANRKGHVYLQMQSLGVDKKLKNMLSAAWEDLHQINPQLSAKLFLYNIYKTGTKFSPYTFLSLCPVSVKKQMGNYTQTYLGNFNMGQVDMYDCMVTFLRHNPKNATLYENLPIIMDEDGSYVTEGVDGYMSIDNIVGEDAIGIRVKEGDAERLLIRNPEDGKWYQKSTLGNEGEYIEYSRYDADPSIKTLQEKRAEKKAQQQAETQNTPQQSAQNQQYSQQDIDNAQDVDIAPEVEAEVPDIDLSEGVEVDTDIVDIPQEFDVVDVDIYDGGEVDVDIVDVDVLMQQQQAEINSEIADLSEMYENYIRGEVPTTPTQEVVPTPQVSQTQQTSQISQESLNQQSSTATKVQGKISTKESPIQVYSDGSDFKGTGNIGYGAVFEHNGKQYGISGTQENQEVKKLQEMFPDAKFSNPTMEMLALATVLEHFAKAGNGEDVVINQDYKGAVNYAGLWEFSEGSVQRDAKPWKAKEQYIKHLVDRAKTAIDKIISDGGSVKINWVKGHQTGNSEQARMNNAADSYAKSRDNINTIDSAYNTQNVQQTQAQNNEQQSSRGLTPAQEQQVIRNHMEQTLQEILDVDVVDMSDIDTSAVEYC